MSIMNLPEFWGINKSSRLRRYLLSLLRSNNPRKFWNLILAETDMYAKREKVKGLPYVLKIETTNRCNMLCPLCYEGRKGHDFPGARGYGKMDLEGFKQIVDDLGRYCYRINLYGFGEPFLADDIYEMIRYAADKRISVSITTNFNTVNEEKIENIIYSGLEHLVISINGVDQESYAKYQIKGDFQKVITNIKILQYRKRAFRSKLPYLDWQFVIMKHNVGLMSKAKEMANALGMGIRWVMVGVDLDKDSLCDQWLPEEEELSQYDYRRGTLKGDKEGTPCSWLYRTTFINWDGGVSPCCNYYTGDKGFDFGNIFMEPFEKIWNNERYRQARRLATIPKGKANLDMNDNICLKCIKIKPQKSRIKISKA